MGLDITLYAAEQAEHNATYEAACEELYAEGPDGKSPSDRMSDEEYEAWRQLNGEWQGATDVPSQRYSDHLFNRRYLRSSYNGSGFNHAVPQMLGSTDGPQYPHQRGSLYWIFAPMDREWDGDEGILDQDDIAKLRVSKARALQVADELRKSDRLRVITTSPNMFRAAPTTTDDEALAMYRAQAETRTRIPGWWSNAEMDVFGDGLSVLAAVPGQATFGVPGVHLIYRFAEDDMDSYVQSAEITAEFCDEAISLIERDGSCRISWSG
jgi:hypothetical protein